MSNNPFADAVKPPDREPITRHVEPATPFFQAAIEAEKLRAQASNMTRQQLFNNGLLTVADMDDEELRAGRMRDSAGRIPKATKTMETIPRDLYDAMVLEHQTRTQERYRQNMDAALDTIVGIMTDPAVEPRDRLEAAKHVKEQVMGKTPDRVQVAVAKAPWEEMFLDFATTSRERHAKLEQGVIDVEVEDVPEQSGARDNSRQGGDSDSSGPGMRDDVYTVPADRANVADYAEAHAYTPHREAEPTPTHDKPASNNVVEEVANHQLLRWERCDQLAAQQRRADFQERITEAKKRRKAMRESVANMVSRHTITTNEVPNEHDPTTGKLTHTID